MIKVIPNKNNIAAEIECNLKFLTKTDITKIKSCLIKYGLIYFRNQRLTSKEYLKFSKIFGKPTFYPRLKGLSKKYPHITVVQRKSIDKGPNFGEQFHTDSSYTKKPPKFTMLFSKIVPRKGLGNTDFSSQYLAYKYLPLKLKNKLKNLKGVFSSNGPIVKTTIERTKEKGNLKKELIAKHKIIRSINGKKTLYCSPGHLISFNKSVKNFNNLKNVLFKHQTKKQFQYSLEWEKDQIAIWDNRSMLHQATAFNGNRKMHRITIT
jgi:alpha-ketoglutarate-dependent taurine dioxygenase